MGRKDQDLGGREQKPGDRISGAYSHRAPIGKSERMCDELHDRHVDETTRREWVFESKERLFLPLVESAPSES